MLKIEKSYYDDYIILNQETGKYFAAIEYKGKFYRSRNNKEFNYYHGVMAELNKRARGEGSIEDRTYNLEINITA